MQGEYALAEGGKLRHEEGVALILVLVMVAVISALGADFSYNAHVEFAEATNARDELKAHYLARSAISLANLLLTVQQKIIDPNRRLFAGMDLQIADYAPMLMSAFVDKEGAKMLGDLLGVQAGPIKGVGVGSGTFDIEMESMDGRINVNCGGGANPGAPEVRRSAAALAALFAPQRYNPLFEQPQANGNHYDRATIVRTIIDWADQDEELFGTSAPEAYRYGRQRHRYYTKNQYFDSLDELRLLEGIGPKFMSTFSDQLSVYGSCRINVNLADVPTILALIVQYAASPNDPGLEPRNLALLSRYVAEIGASQGGFSKPKDFRAAIEDPMTRLGIAQASERVISQGESELPSSLPPVVPIKMAPALDGAISGSGPRRIWRLVARSESGRVRKRITAIWDQKVISMHAQHAAAGPGAFVYWRED